MKTTILLILLIGAFLGGYHCSRLPGAPDIFGWAQESYRRASDVSEKLAAIADGKPDNVLQTATPEELTICADGKVYALKNSRQVPQW